MLKVLVLLDVLKAVTNKAMVVAMQYSDEGGDGDDNDLKASDK